jgi:virulence factor Mce-like protein
MTRVLLGIVAALAVGVAGWIVLAGTDGEESVLRAEFKDAAGLREGSLVRVSGATVGSVKSLRLTARDTAAVELALEEDVTAGAGASAAIRAANLLGEKFVDLTVGDRARPLPSPSIPLSRTSTPVELDDVLDVLDPTTRGRLGLLLGELGIALGGRGDDLKAALRALPNTLEDARGLLAHLSADTHVLERLLVEADAVTESIARERGSLGRLVTTGARALAAPAARRAQLDRTVRAVPSTLAQLRATLRRLDRAGAALRPAARGLRATGPSLNETLRALPGFDRAAAPALRTLTRIAPSLAALGRRAAPVVRRLRPTAASLRGLATDADPLTKSLDESAANVLSVMQNWALAIQTRDAASHVFRVALSFTPDMLRQLDAYVTSPPARKQRGAARRPAPTTAGREVTRRLPVPVKRALDRGVAPVKKVLDSATGDQQVTRLLDFLLER